MSYAVPIYEGHLRLIDQDLWENLRRWSALKLETMDPNCLAELLEKASRLATDVLKSPRGQIYEQYQALK